MLSKKFLRTLQTFPISSQLTMVSASSQPPKKERKKRYSSRLSLSCASTLTSCVIYTLEHQLHHLPETEDSKFVKANTTGHSKDQGFSDFWSRIPSPDKRRGEEIVDSSWDKVSSAYRFLISQKVNTWTSLRQGRKEEKPSL